MTDTELPSVPLAAPAPAAAAAAPERPAFIPEKFWDGASGRVRLEELAKSYGALERRMSRTAAGHAAVATAAPAESAGGNTTDTTEADGGDAPEFPADDTSADSEQGRAADDDLDVSVPASPEEYTAAVSHPWLQRDGEIDSLLHACGFNQAQAQLVYDLAAERVVPAIERMAAEFERRLAQAKLEQHFGGAERFAGIARQVKGWAERHLPRALGPVLYTKTCLYTLTPDRDFVIDRVPGHDDIVVAIGAGHAFKFASVIGRILSELALAGTTPSDIGGFRITRPILGESNPERHYMQ